jgi:hypothetical protein
VTPSVHLGIRGRRSGAVARARAVSRPSEVERCCSSHSPTLRPWIAEIRRPTWRSFGARRSCVFGKCVGKSRGVFSSEFCCAESAGGSFSLRRGLGSVVAHLKLGITPLVASTCFQIRRRRPFRIALAQAVIRLTSARRPLREGRRCHGPALVRKLVPERDRRGACRFGEDHRVVAVRHVGMHLRPNAGCTQVSFRSSNELHVHGVRNADRNLDPQHDVTRLLLGLDVSRRINHAVEHYEGSMS